MDSSRPDNIEELVLYRKGYQFIGGVDEVGRGSIAGPVVAAIVILPKKLKGSWQSLINDSKQLTPIEREYIFNHLQESSDSIGIGESSSKEIDNVGIAPATRLAIIRALESLSLKPQFLLLDAFLLPESKIPQKAIIHGDCISISIAAASIIAKVTRDRIMIDFGKDYPNYGFEKHKGYATKEHLTNLKLYGPCNIHRFSWKPLRDLGN